VAIITCLGLAACGGSSHRASTATPAASGQTTESSSAGNGLTRTVKVTTRTVSGVSTTTTTSAAAPPEVPRTKTHRHPGESGAPGHGGVSQGAHVEANMTVNAAGDVSPPVVSVPSGIGVQLNVTNHGTSVVTVSLAGTVHASARLNPGSSGQLRPGALPNGTYRILVNGTPRGQLMIGAQGGP
jgi:hypothetical protein